MNDTLRYRQIHLDFHTSEHIKNVGAAFDPEEFTNTLLTGNVDSATLFARCHHGWCYYPTKLGKAHPHLARPDLLGEMISACREKDIATPLYLTVQWDERMAREHPEWRVMSAYNSCPHWPGMEPSAMNQLTHGWHTLCLNHREYVDYLTALALELIELYDAEGFFMDILGSHECVCPACLERMQRGGLDPEKSEDRKRNDRNVNLEFFRTFSEAIYAKKADCRIFFNSGHIYKGERDRYEHYSHLELESLPTGGWGYDHFPLSARYADTLGMELLGMTGKFHSHWGEFGGFKRPAALEFECSHMSALGTKCSIGDQLHPSGRIDPETYRIIAPAYGRVKKLEPYLRGSRYQRQIAILSAEAFGQGFEDRGERISRSDAGAARMLLELKYPFDVIDGETGFEDYRLLIIPDEITMDEDLARRLNDYAGKGGLIIHSGSSGMDHEKKRFLLKDAPVYSGERSPWDPDYIHPSVGLDPDLPDSPIVMYGAPYQVQPGSGRSLGSCLAPYFNRSWDHFCSHLHTPVNEGAAPYSEGIVRTAYGCYFAHEIFTMYHDYGQPLYKYMLRGVLEQLLPEKLVRTDLPSAGRVSLLKQEGRYLLNLLYAPTQNRGSSAPSQDGRTLTIEIIEDVPRLREVHASLRIAERPVRIYDAYSDETLPWMMKDGAVEITLPELYIHGAVVVEYE